MPRQALALIAFSLVVFLVVAFGAANFRYADTLPYPYGGDFLQEYVGGWLVLHGDHTRFYDIPYAQELEHDPAVTGYRWQSERWFPMIYPPSWYVLVSPLQLLPIQSAALVWLALMIAAFSGSIGLLARHYPQRVVLLWALPAGVFFLPTLESLSSGQKATLLLLILSATFVLLDRGRPLTAGLVFGLIAFKPQLALVIGVAMLCKRQWRFVAGSLATALVLVGLCFVLGVDVCRQYLDLSLRLGEYIETAGYPVERMHSWYGFVRLLLPHSSLELVQVLTLIMVVLTLGVLVRLLWGPLQFGKSKFAQQFSGLVLATLLLSPHLLTYDLTLLLLPMLLLVLTLTEPDSPLAKRARPFAWLLTLLYVLGGVSAMFAPLVHVQASVLAMFALLLLLSWSQPSHGPADLAPAVPAE
jgi:alpha-1,2-mannosyltransferase